MLKRLTISVIFSLFILVAGTSMIAHAQDFSDFFENGAYFGEEIDFHDSGMYIYMDGWVYRHTPITEDSYCIRASGNLKFELVDERPVLCHDVAGCPDRYYYNVRVSSACPVYGTFCGATGEVSDRLFIESLQPDKKPIGVEIEMGGGTSEFPYSLCFIYSDEPLSTSEPSYEIYWGDGSTPEPSPAQAVDVAVTLNSDTISFDQPPIIVYSRTLVPLRAIFEAMGAEVDWIQANQTVTAVKDDIAISLQIGSNKLYKNGEVIELDVPAQVVNNRTLVPVRAISEAFGAEVDWDNDTRTVIIIY